MKKIFLTLSVLTLFVLGACSEDDSNNIGEAYFFTNAAASYAVSDDEAGDFVELEINSTQKSNVDRTFTISVDESSTATPAMYSLETTQVVIPAGSFSTTVKVFGNYTALPEEGSVDLVLAIADTEESLSDKRTATVNMFRFCTPENVTLSFIFDFYASETTWQVKNAAGVTLYSGGPYADGNAPVNVNLELCSGAYTLTVNDSYGDGMFDGAVNGSFTLTQNGVVLGTGGGNFGATTTLNFTVN
ncbi:hypothetical protein [Flavobacterium orientale]|uniref:DUF4843 domain-containing protein n=1 Tax=Flavobacterium orientale TaxID=1756020 RepID=A0A916XVL5_9FLAO|nr:hypothetical protein [Flavobacterium orientale]GGD14535.1 hypothetical protein GCM10011343_02020 [Flavobacterium orientale]